MRQRPIPWKPGEIEHIVAVCTGRRPSVPPSPRALTDAQIAAEAKRQRKRSKLKWQ